MNRLSILVAACLLGTGCVTHDTCDVRTIRVDWSNNFLRGDGTPGSCAVADLRADPAVVNVDVFVNGQYYDSRSCANSFLDVVGVTPGDYEIIVEGRDARDYVVTRDLFTVNASDSCADIFAKSQPAEGLLQLTYSFSDGVHPPTGACVQGSDVAFSITDTLIGSGPSAAAYPPSTIPCSSGVIPLAYGSYRLNWLQELSGGTVESSACGLSTAFNIGAATTTSVGPIAMTVGGPACQ